MMIRLCAQGRCRFGDKTHVLRLHDCNANLCVIDLSTPTVEQGRPRYPKKADFFHVDPEDGGKEHLAEAVYGHPLLLHGRLWNVTVSADGTSVAAKPYEAPVGRLAFDNASWEATLVGAKHVVHLKGGRDPVPVPVDRYLMTIFKENRLNRKGEVTCRLDMYASGWKPEHQVVVDVKADGRHEIAIGSPLNVTLEVTQKEGRLHFKPVITDRAGRPIYGHGYLQQIHGPYMPHWNPEVTITIVSPDGERVAGITRKLVDDVSWPVPPGLRGAYTATITYPDDAFPYECKPAAFTIR